MIFVRLKKVKLFGSLNFSLLKLHKSFHSNFMILFFRFLFIIFWVTNKTTANCISGEFSVYVEVYKYS